MLDSIKAYKHANKMQRSRDALRTIKAAFVQQGLIDWHLPSHQANTPIHASIPHDDVHQDEGDVDVVTAPPQVKHPPLYAVLLFNDDYTPMEFVIEVLQHYFSLDLDRATEVMLTVHYKGKGVAGTYPRDIAETKAQQVNSHARSKGHPLLCQIEPQSE